MKPRSLAVLYAVVAHALCWVSDNAIAIIGLVCVAGVLVHAGDDYQPAPARMALRKTSYAVSGTASTSALTFNRSRQVGSNPYTILFIGGAFGTACVVVSP